jgi:hypothetical protein
VKAGQRLSMSASRAAEIATAPSAPDSAGDGRIKRPLSSRLAYSDMPIPSCQMISSDDRVSL